MRGIGLLLLHLLPVVGRSLSFLLVIDAAEIKRIVITDNGRDLSDCVVGGFQQILRVVHADAMLMAGLVQQRPLQEAAPVAQAERVEKAENPWWFFTQGILLGAGMATLLLIGILI